MSSWTPPPPLSALVARIRDCNGARQLHRLERILPSAHAQLIFNPAEDETRVYDDALHCRRNALPRQHAVQLVRGTAGQAADRELRGNDP
ncbi:hypothetical protein [Luteimonas suaedae]|uniref:hypothetical protein n=1 Tax=Luteimonas suaedae TaxID=2605430 RepID=UPI0011EBEB3E|nr:hypothetical protein [Luteimonas suaedae]